MPVSVDVDHTPNANAMKFTLDRRVVAAAKNFDTPEKAQADPLAAKLMAIDGVVSVFMVNNFVTVNVRPGTDWEPLIPRVTATLQGHFA